MIDLREHGGIFGGGISKSKQLSVSESTLSPKKAILSYLDTPRSSLSYKTIYVNDEYAVAYAKNGGVFVKLSRETENIIATYNINTISGGTYKTISNAAYDESTDSIYMSITNASSYQYLARYDFRNNQLTVSNTIQSYYAMNLDVFKDYIIIKPPFSNIYILPKLFTSTSTAIAEITNSTGDTFGKCIYDKERELLFLNVSNQLLVINAKTFTLISQISNAVHAGNMAIDLGKRFAYSVNGTSVKITDVSNNTNVPVATVTLPYAFSNVVGILEDDRDGILIASSSSAYLIDKSNYSLKTLFSNNALDSIGLGYGAYYSKDSSIIFANIIDKGGFNSFCHLLRYFNIK